MGRLIDADFLISYIEEELALKYTGHLSDDVVCGMISRQNEIIQFIKAQPTAFDVEAVVKELEKKSSFYHVAATYATEIGNIVEAEKRIFAINAIQEAIEIVRRGGVK